MELGVDVGAFVADFQFFNTLGPTLLVVVLELCHKNCEL
jgi:hypothetical protein